MKSRLTLGQVFGLSFLGLILLLGFLFYLVLDGSWQSILQSSERSRSEASREIADRVMVYLSQAEQVLKQIEDQISHNTMNPHDTPSLESGLFSILLSNKNVAELTLTYGKMLGYDPEGKIRLTENGRGQLSVFRFLYGKGEGRMEKQSSTSQDCLLTRRIYFEGRRCVSDLRDRPVDCKFSSAPLLREKDVCPPDPTGHLTFTTPASRDYHGRLLWSDLHWVQSDSHLPEAERRVELSVQKAIDDGDGHFAGVLRVGLLTDQIDQVTQMRPSETGKNDPHVVLLCDRKGRLITRSKPGDHFQAFDNDLRVVSSQLAPEVAMALKLPMLQEVSSEKPLTRFRYGRFISNGRRFLVTFRALGETQDWIVGILLIRRLPMCAMSSKASNKPKRPCAPWANTFPLILSVNSIGKKANRSLEANFGRYP